MTVCACVQDFADKTRIAAYHDTIRQRMAATLLPCGGNGVVLFDEVQKVSRCYTNTDLNYVIIWLMLVVVSEFSAHRSIGAAAQRYIGGSGNRGLARTHNAGCSQICASLSTADHTRSVVACSWQYARALVLHSTLYTSSCQRMHTYMYTCCTYVHCR
jgi:hypothetical protein